MTGAMLDCAVCSTRKWQTFEPAHEDELRLAGATRLYCSNCAHETYWLYSQHDSGAAPERRAPEPPPSSAEDSSTATEASASAPPAEKGNGKQETMRSSQSERRNGLERRARPRRTNRRVALQMPVRIRVSTQASQFEEVTRTVNVSRNGIYFQTERPYTMGLPTHVALNYSPHASGPLSEQKGTVVRVDSEAGSRTRGVAIQLQ